MMKFYSATTPFNVTQFSFIKIVKLYSYKIKTLFAVLIMALGSLTVLAQPAVTSQPVNYISACPPVDNSSHTMTTGFGLTNNATTCGNSGNFTFVWQYLNGATWSPLSLGTPTGFTTYTPNSSSVGSNSNVVGYSTLTIQLGSTVNAGTYQFRCIATYSRPCSPGSSSVTSNTVSFTVFSKPSPTLTSSTNTTCENSSVIYTTEAGQSGYSWTIPGAPGTDYNLISGGINTSSTATIQWLKFGSKVVTINYANANGCVASSVATTASPTTVNAAAVPTFISPAASTVCASTDVTYTTQPSQTNYVWTVPGTLGTDYSITSGGIGTGSNTVTLQWLKSGAEIVKINYNNSNGCSATSSNSSNSVSVTARPVPSFVSPPSGNICSSTDVTYTTQSGGGQSNYVWSIPGTLGTDYTITAGSGSSTSSTITLKWLSTGSKTVAVNYTTSGCTGLTAASSTVNVNLRPTVSFTASPGANTCASTDVPYTTQAGQANYVWTVEGVLGTDYSISSGSVATTSNNVTIKWLTTGASRTVTVNYTNSNSCTALTAATSTTFINPRPSPTFVSSPTSSTCANTDVTYATQSGQSSYVWTVPGTAGVDYTISSGGIGSSNNTVTLQWLTAGSKTVTVNYSNANGCNALAAVSSATTVNIPATPTVTSGTSAAFCTGGSVALTSSSGSGYQWYKNGTIITGATLISYTANAAGTYTVTVTNASGCVATSAGTTVTINPLPAITTLAQATSTCFSSSTQISKLSYSAVTNSPTSYSITWNSAATSAGFAPVTNAALPASPININVPANAPVNSYVGTITVTNANGCTSASNSFTLDVTAAPNVSNFSIAAANSCINSGATITINSSTLANGTYTVSYDLSGLNTATGNTASMIFTAGTGTFITSVLSNLGLTNITATQVASVGCSAFPAANTASFTVNSVPVINSSTGPNNVCVGNMITLTNSTGGGGWSSSNTAIATVNSSGIVTGVSAGSVNIIYTTAPNGNNCTSSFSSPITVNALPAISLITGTTTLCMGTTTNLNNATVGGTWSSSNTSVATVNNAGLVTASATTSGTSIITYTIPADGNGCSNSTIATVTVDPAASVNSGNATAITVCQSATPGSVALTGATVGGGATTGAWSIVSGGGSLSSVAQTSSPAIVTYTPASNFSGTVTLLLTTNQPGSCPAVTSTRTITVSQAPTVSAGLSTTVCQSASPTAITLNGTSLGGGAATAAWSITSGTGTLSSTAQTATPDAVTFTPTANFSGAITLTLTTNASGACAAATATRTVNVTAIPTVTAGGPDTKCQGASVITLAGAGYGGGANTAAWSITSSGGGTLSSTAPTASPATVTYTPVGTFNGIITLTLTSDAPGGCAAVNTTRTININAPSTATAGTAVTTCSNAGAVNITAGSSTTNSTGVAWTSSGTGTFTNATSLTAATYAPSVADISAGSVTLTLTATGNLPCSNATSSKTLTISAGPTANAGTAITTCSDPTQTSSGSSAVSITTLSSASNYSSLLWSSSGSGTFTNPTSLTTATYTPSAADKLAVSVTLTLTAFGTSPCVNATSTKTFTITPAIDGTAANSWTQVATCSGSGVLFAISSPPGGGNGIISYQWMSKNNCGVAGTSTPIPGATGMSYLPTDFSACYWLFISSGGCAVPQNLVSTTTRQNPSATTASSSNVTFNTGSATNLCIGNSIPLTATSAVSYTYAWSPSTGLSATSGPTVTANPTTTITYTVTATATDGTGCQKSAPVTVTVNPLTVAGSLPATLSVCTAGSNPLILTGNVGTVTQWESSINGGTSWTTIANTTTTLSAPVAAQTTLYRALVQSGACSSAYTTIAKAGLHNLWAGTVSTDWQTATNWSDGLLPSVSCPNVTIPAGTPFSPILSSGTATINNLIINSTASLKANGGLLQIAGGITNSGGSFDAINGTLEFNGTTASQSISGNIFVSNTLKNLTLTNVNGLTVSGAGIPLNITGILGFGSVNGATLSTGDNIVLISNAAGTAMVGDITNNGVNSGNKFTGKVAVERYYPALRAWRLVTAPLLGAGSVFSTWQNGGTYIAGRGTYVTGPTAPADGLDLSIRNNPSLKIGSLLDNVSNTITTNLSVPSASGVAGNQGFLIFVRGDRLPGNTLFDAVSSNITTLSSTGTLQTGDQQFNILNSDPEYVLIGNPYASPVDFFKLYTANNAASNNIANEFVVYDPHKNSSQGGYVSFTYSSGTGTYISSAPTSETTIIQSSQAIFMRKAVPLLPATVKFTEPLKSTISNGANFRPMNDMVSLRTNLYLRNADGSTVLADGNFAEFDNRFSAGVNRTDALKFGNVYETLGLLKGKTSIAISFRPVLTKEDTIYYKFSRARQLKYQFEFEAVNLEQDNLAGFVEDKFLNKATPINMSGTTKLDFEGTQDAASRAVDRFKVVFKPSVIYTSLAANVLGSDIGVEWNVANETNIKGYDIERSTDGTHFTKVSDRASSGNSATTVGYNWLDVSPALGYYYYRIRSISHNNVVGYSNVVKVKLNKSTPAIYVFPNPVIENIHLQMNSMPKGIYYTRLVNNVGQIIGTSYIGHLAGTATETITPNNKLLTGIYQLEITAPDKKTTTIKVIVK